MRPVFEVAVKAALFKKLNYSCTKIEIFDRKAKLYYFLASKTIVLVAMTFLLKNKRFVTDVSNQMITPGHFKDNVILKVLICKSIMQHLLS